MSTATVLQNKTDSKLKTPSRYAVILLNDDYTPMDFVVDVLETFFQKTPDEAVEIMLKVHHEGKGVCGIYSREIAEMKVSQVNECSAEYEHPLVCTMEKL